MIDDERHPAVIAESAAIAVPAFAASVQLVADAFKALAAAAESGDLGELVALAKDKAPIHPDAMAQLLMDVLPMGETRDARMPLEQKVYWAKVAEWMGPDWLESYRKVGAYMMKVEGF